MKELITGFRALFVFTLLTGVLYPIAITLLGKGFFPNRSSGSIVIREDQSVGSELIAQEFKEPRYFWPRPSAAKYDGASSAGSNLSVTSSDFHKVVHERESQGATAEIRYASGSGLDPHISPEAAFSQVGRVARTREIREELLTEVVKAKIEERQLGFLGQKRVNVLLLNLELDRQFRK